MNSASSWGPNLQMNSLEAGCILYLRSVEEVSAQDIATAGIRHECLKHPCLVLAKIPSTSPSMPDVIRICTVQLPRTLRIESITDVVIADIVRGQVATREVQDPQALLGFLPANRPLPAESVPRENAASARRSSKNAKDHGVRESR